MKIVVTGSVAFDYLMSFPGKFTEHILPEHLDRLSVSFLVDTMEKRRGGCGPNIAYTLALLGERPFLMATAGEDFSDYRRWLEAAGIDTSLVKRTCWRGRKRSSSRAASTDARWIRRTARASTSPRSARTASSTRPASATRFAAG